VDVVVVVVPVQEGEEVPHLHNRHPQCKVFANPNCKLNRVHHLDKDHKRTHHPTCSSSTVTWCRRALGLVAQGPAQGLVLVAKALAQALGSSLGSALGLANRDNPRQSHKTLQGLCCILHQVRHR